ncbi:ABC transporter permease/M1 family aminopeptidase [Daejeonella lutea]|nr:M1 family aminopeptidase [Daejeonella lutea]
MELSYQLRQVSTWLYFLVMMVLAFLLVQGNFVHDARDGYHLVNAPVIVGCVTVLCCTFWLLIGGAVAGDAAARDVQTRMFSLTYTSPARKSVYLGGRLLAAFLLNGFILTGIPLGILLTMYFTGIEAELLGTFRPATYLSTYFFLVLPNAFFATSIQFALAAVTRKSMASFLGGAILFVAAYILGQVLDGPLAMRDLGTLIDPMGLTPVLAKQSSWSTIELNTRLIELEGIFLANRLVWLGISLSVLAFAYFRFQFTSPASVGSAKKSVNADSRTDSALLDWRGTASLPLESGDFNLAAGFQQLRVMVSQSFMAIAKKGSGLYLLAFIALIVGAAMPGNLKAKGVPLLASTDQVLLLLNGPLTNPGKFWILIYLLTIFYAGELLWRERESGVAELLNPAPVPNWVLFVSKFLALALMLICWLVFLTTAGILAQLAIGGASLEPSLYLKTLFGFQLIECLIFAALILFLHVLINQKYVAHLVSLIVFACIVYAANLGLEHKLLIFSASPEWSYTSMGGFQSVSAWLWFKAYWIGWSLLLAVIAKLLWVRSRETSLGARLQQMRRRFSRQTAFGLSAAVALVVLTGGFIYYNTNILNEYVPSTDITAGRAEYEHRYGRYRNLAQPLVADVDLHVEIFPGKRQFTARGNYQLVNRSPVSIDTILVAVSDLSETNGINFSPAAKLLATDREAGVLIYTLQESLSPGDSLRMNFLVEHQARGFTNNGEIQIVKNKGTNFSNREHLPVIGYQPYRELDEAGKRKEFQLAARQTNASLYDLQARKYAPFAEHIKFNAVVVTDADQLAVAPGTLRKTWTKGKRKYFHYASDALIRNEYFFFSANYASYRQIWKSSNAAFPPVAIEILNNPGHSENISLMVNSVKASLDYFSREFGPYPHKQIRFVSYPGYGMGNHASTINITAEEGFFLLNPKEDERGFDLVTAVVAHELAHQWWGNQLRYAYLEGAGLLSESLAWYTAMGVMEEKYGAGHLEKLLNFLREEYENPRTRAAVPLLMAADFYQNYRKGPLALYAMSKYIGRNKVNTAIRNLLNKHSKPGQSLSNSLDLYHELEAVTPDSVQYLLADLFKRNTFWDLEAKQAKLRKTKTGQWEVTFVVNARKSLVSARGRETEVPLRDWIEIGIYAHAKNAQERRALYLDKYLIHSKQQTITVTVPTEPAVAAIDPANLLIDWDTKDNFIEVKK